MIEPCADTCLLPSDLKSELPVAAGSAHTAEIRQICWAPSGRALFSGGTDACLCVWDLSSE